MSQEYQDGDWVFVREDSGVTMQGRDGLAYPMAGMLIQIVSPYFGSYKTYRDAYNIITPTATGVIYGDEVEPFEGDFNSLNPDYVESDEDEKTSYAEEILDTKVKFGLAKYHLIRTIREMSKLSPKITNFPRSFEHGDLVANLFNEYCDDDYDPPRRYIEIDIKWRESSSNHYTEYTLRLPFSVIHFDLKARKAAIDDLVNGVDVEQKELAELERLLKKYKGRIPA